MTLGGTTLHRYNSLTRREIVGGDAPEGRTFLHRGNRTDRPAGCLSRQDQDIPLIAFSVREAVVSTSSHTPRFPTLAYLKNTFVTQNLVPWRVT